MAQANYPDLSSLSLNNLQAVSGLCGGLYDERKFKQDENWPLALTMPIVYEPYVEVQDELERRENPTDCYETRVASIEISITPGYDEKGEVSTVDITFRLRDAIKSVVACSKKDSPESYKLPDYLKWKYSDRLINHSIEMLELLIFDMWSVFFLDNIHMRRQLQSDQGFRFLDDTEQGSSSNAYQGWQGAVLGGPLINAAGNVNSNADYEYITNVDLTAEEETVENQYSVYSLSSPEDTPKHKQIWKYVSLPGSPTVGEFVLRDHNWSNVDVPLFKYKASLDLKYVDQRFDGRQFLPSRSSPNATDKCAGFNRFVQKMVLYIQTYRPGGLLMIASAHQDVTYNKEYSDDEKEACNGTLLDPKILDFRARVVSLNHSLHQYDSSRTGAPRSTQITNMPLAHSLIIGTELTMLRQKEPDQGTSDEGRKRARSNQET